MSSREHKEQGEVLGVVGKILGIAGKSGMELRMVAGFGEPERYTRTIFRLNSTVSVSIGHSVMPAQWPHCPEKRASIRALAMSQKCQKRS